MDWWGEGEGGGGRREAACDSEKGCLFDWPCGCFPTWQPPVHSIATTPSTCLPQGDSSAQRIISIKWEPDTCPYHQRYQGNWLGFPGHSNVRKVEDVLTDDNNQSITCTVLLHCIALQQLMFGMFGDKRHHQFLLMNSVWILYFNHLFAIFAVVPAQTSITVFSSWCKALVSFTCQTIFSCVVQKLKDL